MAVRMFETIAGDKGMCSRTAPLEELAKIIGYDVASGHSVLLKQHLSIMPRLTGGSVEISAKSPVLEGKLGFRATNETVKIPFSELVRAAISGFTKLTYTGKKLYFFVDELEAFSTSKENFDRDIRMIRDLLFAVHEVNTAFRENSVPIYVIAAVRSEVLSVVNRTGEEVGRNVEDFSFTMEWSEGARSNIHPLIQLIKQKIKASEIQAFGRQKNMDPLSTYFPDSIDGQSIGAFLLDGTMYRPRDLVRRLGLVKKKEPSSRRFGADPLKETFGRYSEQMWQEVSEELVPGYEP